MGLSCSLSVKGIKVNVMNILKKLGIGWKKFSFDWTQQTCWLLMYWAIHITKTTKAGKVFTISQFCDLYSYHVRKALLPFQIFLFTNFLPQKQQKTFEFLIEYSTLHPVTKRKQIYLIIPFSLPDKYQINWFISKFATSLKITEIMIQKVQRL